MELVFPPGPIDLAPRAQPALNLDVRFRNLFIVNGLYASGLSDSRV